MLDISVTGLLADALYFSHGGFLQVLCISVMGASCRCFVFQSYLMYSVIDVRCMFIQPVRLCI